jgi:hypothetical protein
MRNEKGIKWRNFMAVWARCQAKFKDYGSRTVRMQHPLQQLWQ